MAAALGAEPIPASFEYKPRLMPSMITEPAKPPKIDSKSKADSNSTAKAAGSQVILLIVVHRAMAI